MLREEILVRANEYLKGKESWFYSDQDQGAALDFYVTGAEMRDQELSLLTEKYERLKQTSEELLNQHCRVVDNSFDIFLDADSERDEYMEKSGIKNEK